MTTSASPASTRAASRPSALRRAAEWCYRTLGRWYAALLALIGFVLFLALVSTAQAEKTDEYAEGVDLPDTSPWYSPSEVYAAAQAIGEQGREEYVQARYTFDVVWPIVYTLFFVVVLSWVFRRVTAPDGRWRAINLFPLVPLAFDYLENLAASIVMTRYPDETLVVVHALPVFSLLKWTTLSACFVLIVVGGVLALRARRQSPSTSARS